MASCKFFFSYARRNYDNSDIFRGKCGNYLRDFYDEVCKVVSNKVVDGSKDEVGYFDQQRIKTGERWGEHLKEGLQNSHILVAVLAPAYFNSQPCGKELQFFKERLNLLEEDYAQGQQHVHIIPVLWEDFNTCYNALRNVGMDEDKFLNINQLQEEGMPYEYLSSGLLQMYRHREKTKIAKVITKISQRIVQLTNLSPLPPFDYQGNFNDLPSAWPKVVNVGEGPSYTNVVYIVGNKEDMRNAECSDMRPYDDRRENWKPFADDNTTVERATQDGMKNTDLTYRNLGFPNDLLGRIKYSKDKNRQLS